MPVTTLLRRVLNRSNTEPNLADAYLTPPVGQTPALELIPEQSPSIADDASHADALGAAQNRNNALAVIASRG
ncbi:hypothetical protein LPJ57_006982, partial [Coemansia sp. RSA 486]